jgi:signal transduction histidine kinase
MFSFRSETPPRAQAMLISRPNVRLALLFVATVLFPCTVLVALALRGMAQERELAVKRALDIRAAQMTDLRRSVESYLKLVASDEVHAWVDHEKKSPARRLVHSESRLVASVNGDRLRLPWENEGGGKSAASVLWEARAQKAEKAEFARGDLGAAADAWRDALSAAAAPSAIAVARLGLARVSAKRADTTTAVTLYRKVLELPIDITDEQGIPFSVYASSALAQLTPSSAHGYLRRLLANECCLSAEALYMIRDALARIDVRGQARTEELQQTFAMRISEASQASALRDQFHRLRIPVWHEGQGESNGPAWSMFGADPWLVSLIATNSDSFVVVISAKAIADSLNSQLRLGAAGKPRIIATSLADTTAKPISPEIAGLMASYPDDPIPSSGGTVRAVYLGTLALVLGAALFGACVLWVDVRRERRLSAMRSDFVASVSHELKTPLTAIRLFAETLAEAGDSDRAIREEYLDTIIRESERLTRLLNNVLDLSKIERNQKAYRRTPTVLGDVLLRAARTLQYPLSQQGFRLRVETDAKPSVVLADADAIEQAILNLLANAMKYSGTSRDIALRLRRVNSDAIIEVQDWGIGIPAEHQSLVSEKFYRVPLPENAGIPGTGLGLTLVDHIARAHDGRLEIASEPRRGSTISIRIPITEVR